MIDPWMDAKGGAISESDAAYLAALIEERGTITLESRRNLRGKVERRIVLYFHGLTRSGLAFLSEKFPSYVTRKMVERGLIRILTAKSCVLLVHAHPYLSSKLKAATLAFAFAKTRRSSGRRPVPREVTRERLRIERDFKLLSSR